MISYLIYIYLLLPAITYGDDSGCSGVCGVNRPRNQEKRNVYHALDVERHQCSIDRNKKSKIELGENERMVLVPAGEYQLGTDDAIIKMDMEGPKRNVKLESFYIDEYEVSNRDFLTFTQQTKYKTDSERIGDSYVFTLFLNSTYREKLKDFRVAQATWWYQVRGADWRHPFGPDSNLSGLLDHPVAHVTWTDAVEYCKHRKARLPTEAEWEAACRAGHRHRTYPWGDKLFPNKKHMANIWQGTFPLNNSAKDGYLGTNPVHLFPQNEFGLHNMVGNVWEWTDDTWKFHPHDQSVNPFRPVDQDRVKKGGSYLCHRSYCYRYRCSARSHNTYDSSAGNLGFRCAKDAYW